MTTGIVIVILVVIVALLALRVCWDSWRSGRAFCTPIPRPYKGRGSQEAVWRDRCGDGLGEADAVLTMLTVIHYCGMGLTKLVEGLFFFIPWLSIKLVLRKAKD